MNCTTKTVLPQGPTFFSSKPSDLAKKKCPNPKPFCFSGRLEQRWIASDQEGLWGDETAGNGRRHTRGPLARSMSSTKHFALVVLGFFLIKHFCSYWFLNTLFTCFSCLFSSFHLLLLFLFYRSTTLRQLGQQKSSKIRFRKIWETRFKTKRSPSPTRCERVCWTSCTMWPEVGNVWKSDDEVEAGRSFFFGFVFAVPR